MKVTHYMKYPPRPRFDVWFYTTHIIPRYDKAFPTYISLSESTVASNKIAYQTRINNQERGISLGFHLVGILIFFVPLS